mmetsp:Transcript_65934/g.143633  ORF Transcript_65934/g.143633 Transcript_65934/m.143633 type:complete len:95 (-) Transcript_65934:20-304(-)
MVNNRRERLRLGQPCPGGHCYDVNGLRDQVCLVLNEGCVDDSQVLIEDSGIDSVARTHERRRASILQGSPMKGELPKSCRRQPRLPEQTEQASM